MNNDYERSSKEWPQMQRKNNKQNTVNWINLEAKQWSEEKKIERKKKKEKKNNI